MSNKKDSSITFSMLFEFSNGDGVVATLKYGDLKETCINPSCQSKTHVSIKLDLSSFNDDYLKGQTYYPICGKCLYKNITILAKYC